jgi:hypothetical protein
MFASANKIHHISLPQLPDAARADSEKTKATT